jgi:hypothetical protein
VIPDSPVSDLPPAPRLGWKPVALATLFYLAVITIATWPLMLWFRSALPERYDSLQHLWVMRWYKTCLLEGRSVFHCPEIQHPIGAPLGNFSSLHLQALLYFPLSLAITNDTICYNIICISGLLLTGLGTFLLAWYLVGDWAGAAFGGLVAMLSTPMMRHAHGHLELIYVGGFPIFLVAWMRFVDRPSRGRMAFAAFGYVVVAMSAAYYMVFALFPAVLYVAWQSWRGGWRGAWPWLRARGAWFAGFVGLTLPFLLVLFSSQFWAMAHGYSLIRDREEFNTLGAPLWSYLIPTREHQLGALLPWDPYALLGPTAGERKVYLGVVTIAMLAYAAIHRIRFRNAGYVWAALALLVTLSLGASWQVGTWRISLPSEWLWKLFPIYRMTRVPARLSLFAGVLAGVVAAAGIRHLLARLPRRALRGAVFGGLAAAAVADLALLPFWIEPMPAMPGCYAFLKQRDPRATLVEIPFLGTGGSNLNAACTYWQALHRLTTSAGYAGHANPIEDARIGHNSPFHAVRLAEPDYLADPTRMTFDFTTHVDFKDFVWLYLTVNRFDYIVLHQGSDAVPEYPVHLDRVKALLQESKIYEDDATVVYARDRLRTPSRPVPMGLEEWQQRNSWQGRFNCLVPNRARLMVYNPDPARNLTLVLDAASLRRQQSVQLRSGAEILARWDLGPGSYQCCVSPPFRLPAGLHELTIETSRLERDDTGALKKPYPLRIARVSLHDEADPEVAPLTALRPAASPSTGRAIR